MNHEYNAETVAAADFKTKANEKAENGWRVISVIAQSYKFVGDVAEPQLNEIIIFFERAAIAGEQQSNNRNLMSGDEPAQVEELFDEGLTEQTQSK
jgi:hypothetical protein